MQPFCPAPSTPVANRLYPCLGPNRCIANFFAGRFIQCTTSSGQRLRYYCHDDRRGAACCPPGTNYTGAEWVAMVAPHLRGACFNVVR